MSYPKIYEVLPKDIILQIQDYIEGEVIYIPKRSENKKSWGDCTDTKEILSLRNKKIYYDYCDGMSESAIVVGVRFLFQFSMRMNNKP